MDYTTSPGDLFEGADALLGLGVNDEPTLSPLNPFNPLRTRLDYATPQAPQDSNYLRNASLCPPVLSSNPPVPVRSALSFPAPTLTPFGGDVRGYHRFMQSFEAFIASALPDEDSKLAYLIQNCSGEPRRLIEDCVLYPQGEGYQRARRLLRAKYGRDQDIVESFLSALTSGPALRGNDAKALDDFGVELERCRLNLDRMGDVAEASMPSTLRRLAHRLPVHLQSQWAEKAVRMDDNGCGPRFADFVHFVQEKARVATSIYVQETAHPRAPTRTTAMSTRAPPAPARQATFAVESACNCPCGNCADTASCQRFEAMNLRGKYQHVRDARLCYCCLRAGHMASACQSPACGVEGCSAKHHRLLHPRSPRNAAILPPPPLQAHEIAADENTGAEVATNVTSVSGHVLLGIVPTIACGPHGKIRVNALIDNGSTKSFITQELVQRLGLSKRKIHCDVATLCEQWSAEGAEVELEIKGVDAERTILLKNAWTVPRLCVTSSRAATKEHVDRYDHLRGIQLPTVDDGAVHLLIGADSRASMPLELRCPPAAGGPYAERTELGWVVRGPVDDDEQVDGSAQISNFVSSIAGDVESIDAQLHKLWDAEFADRSCDGFAMSEDDKRALAKMEDGVRKEDDRYVIALPWRSDGPRSPNSNRGVAMKRLNGLRHKLERNEELREMYTQQIKEYLHNGYAVPAPTALPEPSKPLWYLPHHAVLHPRKPGKVRVVFDAAAQHRGSSLNDYLLSGPDLNSNLTEVLIRFRQHPVAITADIKAMFHQVAVPEQDRDALRFLWWPDGDLSLIPQEFRMTRHVFGLTSSPSCAVFALQQTARDHASAFSFEAVTSVTKNFYVDDFMKSLPTTSDAASLAREMAELLKCGGFELTKWASNQPDALRSIRGEKVVNISNHQSALGLKWDTENDAFFFSAITPEDGPTRRRVLSAVSRIFDPLGLIAPITLSAKVLLQDLTRMHLSWDESIPTEQQTTWDVWQEQMATLDRLSFPRCISGLSDDVVRHSIDVKYQLHIFCDASQVAFGACAYLRVSSDEEAKCHLILGKSRVAPIRPLTVPRLELAAAALASRLRQQLKCLELPLQKTIMWSDSNIVLGYIHNTTQRYKTFVANRLAVIHDSTSPDEWRHVPSRLNPADLASRGVKMTDAASLHMWTEGPAFLKRSEEEWPKQQAPKRTENDAEALVCAEVAATAENRTHGEDVSLEFFRYSTWDQVLRSAAWWMRFIDVLRKKTNARGALTAGEIARAELFLLRKAQERHFKREIERVKQGNYVRVDSRIASLDPALNLTNGLLCTGSRLQHGKKTSQLVILAHKDPLTTRVITDAHARNGHVGVEQTLSITRNRFWVLKGRAAVKGVLHDCKMCRRRKTPLAHQQMAPLIKEQVTPDLPPFTFVGVDLFGPFLVKQRRSSVKRYGVLFTCVTTRAIHLEIAHSLDTDSFLGAFSRFAARRGTPKKMFSDRGTNFVAAEKELKTAFLQLDRNPSPLVRLGIEWSFNPPHASHRGGLWERLIRSVRSIPMMLVQQQPLTDECLLTLFAEAERIINNRPLTHVSSDVRDPEPLTPAKLLLLRGAPGIPIPNEPQSYSRRWFKQAQYLASVFWRRWLKEYIPNLIKRQKWVRPQRCFQPGDVVMINDSHAPRDMWPLGRVIEATRGRDDLVRSVKVKTATKALVRPVTQLCLLEECYADSPAND